ncbi:hypothetical protein ACF3NG_04800 [Aerococcaceae bacterium WGS1372]
MKHNEVVPQQESNLQAEITDVKIEYEDVSFSYDGQQNFLNNISFKVRL